MNEQSNMWAIDLYMKFQNFSWFILTSSWDIINHIRGNQINTIWIKYLSEGSLPGISTKRSWSHTICKKVSLHSWRTDWHTPENLSRYNDTCNRQYTLHEVIELKCGKRLREKTPKQEATLSPEQNLILNHITNFTKRSMCWKPCVSMNYGFKSPVLFCCPFPSAPPPPPGEKLLRCYILIGGSRLQKKDRKRE